MSPVVENINIFSTLEQWCANFDLPVCIYIYISIYSYAAYPDCMVLAAGDHSASSSFEHSDGLLVGTLHWARQLTADHILAAVTGGGGQTASAWGS